MRTGTLKKQLFTASTVIMIVVLAIFIGVILPRVQSTQKNPCVSFQTRAYLPQK